MTIWRRSHDIRPNTTKIWCVDIIDILSICCTLSFNSNITILKCIYSNLFLICPLLVVILQDFALSIYYLRWVSYNLTFVKLLVIWFLDTFVYKTTGSILEVWICLIVYKLDSLPCQNFTLECWWLLRLNLRYSSHC